MEKDNILSISIVAIVLAVIGTVALTIVAPDSAPAVSTPSTVSSAELAALSQEVGELKGKVSVLEKQASVTQVGLIKVPSDEIGAQIHIPIPIPEAYIGSSAVTSSKVGTYTKKIGLDLMDALNVTTNMSINATTCPGLPRYNGTYAINWTDASSACWVQWQFRLPNDYSSSLVLNFTYGIDQQPAADTYVHWDMVLLINGYGETQNQTWGAYPAVNMTNVSAGTITSTTMTITDAVSKGDLIVIQISATETGVSNIGARLYALDAQYTATGLNQ